MFLLRLIALPFLLVWIILMFVLLLLFGSLAWLSDGHRATITLSFREMR